MRPTSPVGTRAAKPMRGDEAALYAAHADQLKRIVRSIVRTSPEAIEDACAYAWSEFVRLQPERTFPVAWLKTVAVYYALRAIRRERRESPVEELPADAATSSVEDDYERAALARECLELLAEMPERRRRIMALLIAGHSYEEITALTGENKNAINKQIVKARHRLRGEEGPNWRR